MSRIFWERHVTVKARFRLLSDALAHRLKVELKRWISARLESKLDSSKPA